MSEDDPRAIKPPEKHPVRTGLRDVAEAAAQAVPVVGPLLGVASALAKTTLPKAEEKKRDRWTEEVTERVNEHDRTLRPTVTITGTTAALAVWMANTSSDGLHEPHVDLDEVAAALGAEHTPSAIEEAAEELAGFDLLSLSRYIGGAIIQPTRKLFEQLDPHVKGWNVDADARALAALALDIGESFAAADLEQRSGFERRRFNPAVSKLLTMFDPNLVSGEIQPDYAAAYAYLTGGTRARLRRFIAAE
jgi:hypothetical protein